MVHTSWKCLWFHWDLLMILHFVKIMGCPELFHEKTPKIWLIVRICWRDSWNMIQKIWGSNRSENVNILEFQKYVSEMIPYCSCICWSIFMRNTGSEDPLRVQNIENFGSSQNHQKNIGIWPGTLISHFGIIKTPKKH